MTEKLTLFRMTAWALSFLIVGACATPDEPAERPRLDFCAAEEPRVFVPGEIEWRTAHAPRNLRLDVKTNRTGERECRWFQGSAS